MTALPNPAAARGKLRIFFGASAGVGKTFAMLSAAVTSRAHGVDVVAGVIETHGQPETQALLDTVEQIPLQTLPHAGGALQEFDVDAALARRPTVMLMDDLAHANAPGARHARRWQDVEALRTAGIDVWTTLDVQQLEGLHGAADPLTGLRVVDTVPDRIFDDAEEVLLVDLPPDELLQRWKEGKVHVPRKAPGAGKIVLRKGRLIALRDLAVRRAAGRTATLIATPSPRRKPALKVDATPGSRAAWQDYALGAAACALVALITAPLQHALELTNIAMLFLLVVALVALRLGRGPAVLAALLSVGAFDFFYVPPRLSFGVGDAQYLLTFSVMLVVALVIGQLTAGLRTQARVAARREERVRALYEMSRELSGALLVEQVAEIGARFLGAEFGAGAALFAAGLDDRLQAPVPSALAPDALALDIAQWAHDHGRPAGHGTGMQPGAPALYLPLKAPMGVRGVLAVEPQEAATLDDPDLRRLLDACASLLAISLERIHYVDVAQHTTVQMESQRLRNSVLAAISHDLRTPLAALVGMADSLTLPQPEPRRAEITRSIRDAALRLNAQVGNLLDMARLQAGQVQLNRQWLPMEEVIGSALRGLEGCLAPERVRVRLPPGLPMLHVDPTLFERVLWNLLENAAKYTPPHSPIEVGVVETSETVRITIDDRGPGLPPQREAAIFQMFERGRKEDAIPGVGLGLAICRAIVDAHGGSISGQTRPEGGARFTVELPRGTAPTLDAPEPTEALPART